MIAGITGRVHGGKKRALPAAGRKDVFRCGRHATRLLRDLRHGPAQRRNAFQLGVMVMPGPHRRHASLHRLRRCRKVVVAGRHHEHGLAGLLARKRSEMNFPACLATCQDGGNA